MQADSAHSMRRRAGTHAFCSVASALLTHPETLQSTCARSTTNRSRRMAMVQHRTHMRCSHTVDVSLSPDRDLPEWRELRDKVRDDSDRMLKLTLTDENSELSVVICSDSYIADLNRTWRQVDGPTDVLSFPQDDDTLLGDVIISVDTAQRQAQARGHGLRAEMRVLLTHGFLHLLGYDHERGQEEHDECESRSRTKMAAAEARVMAKLCWEGEGLIASASVPHIEANSSE